MKVYEIYNKDSNVLDHGKNIFKTTEKYLSKFPDSYSECYRKNISTLELIKVDRLPDSSELGIYNPEMNTIVFSKNYSLGHELMHLASNDRENQQLAFGSKMYIENGLIEGMTEYHHMMAYSLCEPEGYCFEVFSVMMLEDIPNIFESFFVPKERGIFSVFPDRRMVYGLLYSVDEYNQLMTSYMSAICAGENPTLNKSETIMVVRHVIDNLISIKLSICNDKKELLNYGEKFMDLISSDFIGDMVPMFYKNYSKYAEKQIKKRIRERC